MDYLVLICILSILVVSTINGYSKGAIRITLTLASSIVGIILAVMLAQPFSGLLREKTQIDETIEKEMHSFIEDYMSEEINKKADELTGDMLSKLPLPDQINDLLLKNNSNESVTKMGATNVADYISKELSKMIVNAISFIILYILISLAIRIIISMADILTKLPVLKEVNKLAGIVVGLLEGLIIVWVFCIIITGLATTEFGQIVMEQIKNNAILSFIYDNNLLLKILMSVM